MPTTSANATALTRGRLLAERYPIADERKTVTMILPALRAMSAIVIAALAWSGAAWAQQANWPRSIALGTASPGGPYYAYGEGLARILTLALNIETTAQVTQGPAQNIVLMERKEAMLGFITMGVGLQGWNGTEWAKGIRYRSMRVIFPMYDTSFQFAAPKRLELKSLKEFGGQRIGVGPRAGTGGTYVPEIFNVLGIAATIRFGAVDQQTAQIAQNELDGLAFATGVPNPALAKLAADEPMVFLMPSAEEVARIRSHMPELSHSLVPAGLYPGLLQDYRTIGLYNFAIAHENLPDELVYRIVKTVFESREELVKAHPAAKETVPPNIARNTILPLHPGAIRYYREAGIALPPGVTGSH
jgi:uncharacterized protein